MVSTKPCFKRVVFILIDGAPYEIFKTLIENGDLPNIKKHVVDPGSLNKAVSVFPSTTGPAFIPFFMGLYPGTANIPGIRWLSKSKFHTSHRFKHPGICSYMGFDGLRFEADLPPDVPTLFNFFSPVSNIYNLLARGCPPAKKPNALDKTLRLHLCAFLASLAIRQSDCRPSSTQSRRSGRQVCHVPFSCSRYVFTSLTDTISTGHADISRDRRRGWRPRSYAPKGEHSPRNTHSDYQ